MKKRVLQKSAKQEQVDTVVVEAAEVEKDEESFFDASENDLGFICVECGVECKDKTHLRSHILAHYFPGCFVTPGRPRKSQGNPFSWKISWRQSIARGEPFISYN